MSDQDTAVLEIIAKYGRVERDRLVPEARLTDLNIESLDVVEIVFTIEEKFGVEVPFDAAKPQLPFETVADVVKAVRDLVAAKRAA
jgi:acyl carrier protein